MNKELLISIITPSYNQAQFIEKTILSVLDQNYKNIEHIIIDGGSKDGTIEILKKYPHLTWISEPDNGQSNAINKGFKMAKGDILAWLNSDDYYEKDILFDVAKKFNENPSCNFLYGDITYVDIDGKTVEYIKGDCLSKNNLKRNPDIVRQPSSFWRKTLFYKVGGINEQLHLVMDYDLFCRFSKYTEFTYLNKNFSYYRTYPTTKTLSNQRKQVIELFKVSVKNFYFVNPRMMKILIGRFISSLKFGN